MSPNFPPFGASYLLAADPQVRRPIAPRPTPPRANRREVGDRLVLARIIVTVAGVGGFLGLLIASIHVRSAQEILRISAFVWFLGMGAVRVVLDLRASRRSRRGEACAIERDRRLGGRG